MPGYRRPALCFLLCAAHLHLTLCAAPHLELTTSQEDSSNFVTTSEELQPESVSVAADVPTADSSVADDDDVFRYSSTQELVSGTEAVTPGVAVGVTEESNVINSTPESRKPHSTSSAAVEIDVTKILDPEEEVSTEDTISVSITDTPHLPNELSTQSNSFTSAGYGQKDVSQTPSIGSKVTVPEMQNTAEGHSTLSSPAPTPSTASGRTARIHEEEIHRLQTIG